MFSGGRERPVKVESKRDIGDVMGPDGGPGTFGHKIYILTSALQGRAP
jgi:hypothetical protein